MKGLTTAERGIVKAALRLGKLLNKQAEIDDIIFRRAPKSLCTKRQQFDKIGQEHWFYGSCLNEYYNRRAYDGDPAERRLTAYAEENENIDVMRHIVRDKPRFVCSECMNVAEAYVQGYEVRRLTGNARRSLTLRSKGLAKRVEKEGRE